MSARRITRVVGRGKERWPLPIEAAIWEKVKQRLNFPPRQIELTELVLRGFSDEAIAQELRIKVPTVRIYLTRIFDRMKVRNRLGLTVRVFELALKEALSK